MSHVELTRTRVHSPDWLSEGLKKMGNGISPTRFVSDLLWSSLPWAEISATFGRPTVLDIACGRGDYGKLWHSHLPGGLGKYIGLDIAQRSDWLVEQPFERHFQIADVRNMPRIQADLYFSQSALEHFPEDLAFMDALQSQIATFGRPALQVHLFPARSQTYLVGPHGFRTYTAAMAMRLARSAAPGSRVQLIPLGGLSLNRTYLKNFTIPRILGQERKWGEGPNPTVQIRASIAQDHSANKLLWPSFYCLTIEDGIRLQW